MTEQRVRVWVQRFYDRSTLILQWVDPDTGQRKSQSARTTDFEMAEIARRDLEYELNHGIYQETTKLEWERFRELFEGEYLAGLRPRTRERYIGVLDVFERIIKPEKLGAVTERTISLFVKSMREQKRPGNGGIGAHDYQELSRGPEDSTGLGCPTEVASLLTEFPQDPCAEKETSTDPCRILREAVGQGSG